ncbi:MAG: type II secretion system F family protein [Armatimonadota bacterium]
MPVYTYTAKDSRGNVQQGEVEAVSDSQAVAQLREQGLWTTNLKRRGGGGRAEGERGEKQETSLFMKLFPPVSSKDLSLFYRQLYTMLNSGMPLYGSLETLGGTHQSPNQHLRRVAATMAQMVLAGQTLSAGMRRFPWLFDKMQLRMVEAGEMGGLLVTILERLAEYLERDYQLRLEIKKKTLYPKLLLLALILIPPIPILVLGGVVPYLLAVWGTVSTAILYGIPTYVMVKLLLTTQAGRELYDQIKLGLPVIGPLVRKLAVARFSRTLAALYGAGVPIVSAVTISSEATGNSVLERGCRVAAPAMEKGGSIGLALSATRFFPPMFTGMVSTGETTGSLDDTLNKAADFYEQEALHTSVQLVVILGVVLLLIMALIIAIQVIGAWGGYAAGVTGAGGGG